MRDLDYMHLALKLGEQARITAPPNPWVGCVIVNNGTIVGEGYSQPAGQDHAEIVALKNAGDKAKGATVYVTLEPCSHYGKTPPCCEALAEADVSKVVVAVMDLDPRVSGRGIAYLKEQGIEVVTGVGKEELEDSFTPYLYQRKTGRPYVVAKSAISIDGRTAAPDKTSQWITPPEAREDVHRLRAESQAILIGVGTAIADSPLLTVRDTNPLPSQQPLRVVIDSTGRLPLDSPLLDVQIAPTLIVTTNRCSQEVISHWETKGAEILVLPSEGDRVPIRLLLEHLGEQGIIQVLVEGGSTVMERFLVEKWINRLVLYMGPKVIGAKGKPLFGGFTIQTLQDAPEFNLESVRQIDQAVRLDYELHAR